MDRARATPAVILLVLATLVVGAKPATSVTSLPGPCALRRHPGETVQHLSKRRITCAVRWFGPVPGGATRAICIAQRESGLDPSSTSKPSGQYRGLYQHDRDYWPWRYDTFTKPVWNLSRRSLNGRTNSIVTIRMVVAYTTWKAAGWPPKTC